MSAYPFYLPNLGFACPPHTRLHFVQTRCHPFEIMATALEQFVSARLDYIALNREVGRSTDDIMGLEKVCSDAIIKTMSNVRTLTMEDGAAVCKLVLETPNLSQELKLAIQAEIEKRMQFAPVAQDVAQVIGDVPRSSASASCHMSRLQTLIHLRFYLWANHMGSDH